MQFSHDGSMLLAHGKEMRLIDTDDGEVLFRFPMRDKSAQLSRLVHILGPDATEADVGNGEWPFFRGEQLLLPREFEGAEGGKTRRFYDVFDLAEIPIKAGPDFRVADNPEVCAPQRAWAAGVAGKRWAVGLSVWWVRGGWGVESVVLGLAKGSASIEVRRSGN